MPECGSRAWRMMPGSLRGRVMSRFSRAAASRTSSVSVKATGRTLPRSIDFSPAPRTRGGPTFPFDGRRQVREGTHRQRQYGKFTRVGQGRIRQIDNRAIAMSIIRNSVDFVGLWCAVNILVRRAVSVDPTTLSAGDSVPVRALAGGLRPIRSRQNAQGRIDSKSAVGFQVF